MLPRQKFIRSRQFLWWRYAPLYSYNRCLGSTNLLRGCSGLHKACPAMSTTSKPHYRLHRHSDPSPVPTVYTMDPGWARRLPRWAPYNIFTREPVYKKDPHPSVTLIANGLVLLLLLVLAAVFTALSWRDRPLVDSESTTVRLKDVGYLGPNTVCSCKVQMEDASPLKTGCVSAGNISTFTVVQVGKLI